MTGEMCSVDTKRKTIKSLGYYGDRENDTILGLCWLKDDSDKFISGSSRGRVCLGDINKSRVNTDPRNKQSPESILFNYPKFERLTSVHVNCTNKLLLVSGYAKHTRLYDLETGAVVREYNNIHTDHINISRFCNHSPHLFATSSFDGTVKAWDLRTPSFSTNASRQSVDRCIYSVKCGSGVVMINFSNDDSFLLASALDNEINQYLFVDGRKHLSYDIPKTGQKGNFTRAYYSSSGRHVVTGACEESEVKVMCTYTGEVVTTVDLYPEKKDKSIYVQSLRGSPVDEASICVLTNYRDIQNRELLLVTLKKRGDDRGVSYDPSTERVMSDTDGNTQHNNTINDCTNSTTNNNNSGSSNDGSHVRHTANAEMLSSFPSPQYSAALVALRNYARQLTQSRETSQAGGVTHIDLHPAVSAEMAQTHSPDGNDMAYLCHSGDCSTGCHIWAVHSWVLQARCPALLSATDTTPPPVSVSLHMPSGFSLSIRPELIIDLSTRISASHLYLLPVVLDFLYVGRASLDTIVLRFCSLTETLANKGDASVRSEEERMKELIGPDLHDELSHVFHNNRHSLLVAVCEDDEIWRLSTQLRSHFFLTARRLLELCALFILPHLASYVEQMLSRNLDITTAVEIHELACLFGLVQLHSVCVLCVARHWSVFSSLVGTHSHLAFMMEDTQKVASSCITADVLTREQFNLKWQNLADLAAISNRNNDSSNSGKMANVYTDISAPRDAADALWMHEEAPYMDGGGDSSAMRASICLSKYVSSEICNLGKGRFLILGGMNRDRIQPMSRILMYNSRTDSYSHLQCGGTALPIATNAVNTAQLEKREVQHVLVMGGNLKRVEPPIKHSFLSQSSLHDQQYMPCKAVVESSGTTFKLSSEDRAEAAATVDSDEEDFLRSELRDESTMLLDTYPNHTYRHKRRRRPNSEMFFVLDCQSLTWSAPSVVLGNDSSLDRNTVSWRNSTAYISNAGLAPEKKRQRSQLRVALRKRVAHTMVPLFDEDVPYRCASCLFRNFSCDRCGGSSTSHTWLLQFGGYCSLNEVLRNDVHILACSRNPVSPQTNSVTQDSHTYRWFEAETSGTRPHGRFSNSAVIVPSNKSVSSNDPITVRSHTRMIIYGGISHPQDLSDVCSLRVNDSHHSSASPDLHWETVVVSGTSPGRRHGHTMTYLPDLDACVLFGGIFTDDNSNDFTMNDVWLLHLSDIFHTANGEMGLKVQWRLVTTTSGPTASPRSKHASCLSDDGAVFIFGGVDENALSPDDEEEPSFAGLVQKYKDSEMHCLRVQPVKSFLKGTFAVDWQTKAIPSTYSHFKSECAVNVPLCSVSADILSLLASQFSSGSSSTESECSAVQLYSQYASPWSVTMEHYHSVPAVGDVTLELVPVDDFEPAACLTDEDVAEDTADKHSAPVDFNGKSFTVIGSLTASRCDWLRTILTSNMTEAQTRRVVLRDADPSIFRLLLIYLYGDVVAHETVDQLYSLMVLANKYGLPHLSKRGEGVLLKHLAADSACYLLEVADFLSLDLLKTVCIAQLLRCRAIARLFSSEEVHLNALKFPGHIPISGSVVRQPDKAHEEEEAALLVDFVELREDLREEVRRYWVDANHVFAQNSSV